MNRVLSHRERAQAMVGLIGVMMLALIGTVAVVADWGMFFVLQRELQSAADAGALAAVWYEPVCDPVLQSVYGCQPASSGPIPQGPCTTANRPPSSQHDEVACEVAREFTAANLGSIVGLCEGFDPLQSIQPYRTGPVQDQDDTGANNGVVPRYVVMLDCRARHLMGTVLPNVPSALGILQFPPVIATGSIGYLGADGDIEPTANGTDHTLISRLVS